MGVTVVAVGELPSLQGLGLNYFHYLIAQPANKNVIPSHSVTVTCAIAAGKLSPCPLCDRKDSVDTAAGSQSFEVPAIQHSITGLSN
jgi:hypothetical protein